MNVNHPSLIFCGDWGTAWIYAAWVLYNKTKKLYDSVTKDRHLKKLPSPGLETKQTRLSLNDMSLKHMVP